MKSLTEIGAFIEGVSFRSIEPVPIAEGRLREFLLLSLGVNDVPGLLTKGGRSKHSHPQPPKLLGFVSRNLGAHWAECCPDMVATLKIMLFKKYILFIQNHGLKIKKEYRKQGFFQSQSAPFPKTMRLSNTHLHNVFQI